MVEKGIYDLAADEIVKRYGLVKEEIIRRNKGKRPFRMEEVTPEQKVKDFSEFIPEKEQMMRQTTDDESVDNYIKKMQELMLRRPEDVS